VPAAATRANEGVSEGACQIARGPKLDIVEFQPVVIEALARVRLSQLAADAGYNSEANHRFARQECRIRSIIPPTRGVLPTNQPVGTTGG
jgi:hypothetical protein